MPYLNLDLDYFSHPKVVRLVGLLGQEAFVVPIRLWTYAGKHHAERGLLEGYSKHELEAAMSWSGEKDICVDALLKVGLLEEIKNGFKIHDWKDHAGHLSAFKRRAKSAAKKRWSNYATSIAKSKTTNAPNLSSPLLTVPLQEDKKEETPLSRSPRDFMRDAREVLQFLNAKTGRNYREVDSNLKLIAARLRGQSESTQVDVQTCKSIIAKKVRAWGSDPKMMDYLRPETLFGKTKFESYLGELCAVPNATESSPTSQSPAPAGGVHLRSL